MNVLCNNNPQLGNLPTQLCSTFLSPVHFCRIILKLNMAHVEAYQLKKGGFFWYSLPATAFIAQLFSISNPAAV